MLATQSWKGFLRYKNKTNSFHASETIKKKLNLYFEQQTNDGFYEGYMCGL